MTTLEVDVAVIGGGPAGMAAALAAAGGEAKVALIDRNAWLGGILPQCIHDGFGLIRFGEMLTGPEYAERFIEKVAINTSITIILDAMVTKITPAKQVYCVTRKGVVCIVARALVFATGCRERTRGAIAIPGTRPAGVYTAGVAQQLINVYNIAIGKRAVILGSGDVGLIMARRLTLCGTEVVCVLEKLPVCGGLPRNVSQCLDDYRIPLYLKRTVVSINGKRRLTSITVASVDDSGTLIPGSEYEIACDTLLLSVGLIPENEIIKQLGIKLLADTKGPPVNDRFETEVAGVFACGNSLHVSDLVDKVSDEGELAGKNAALYAA